mgnify:CR=1 FL=1
MNGHILSEISWVLRGKRQYLAARPEGITLEENRSLYMDERECLKNAYEGFLKAISSETFPIAGMDENTLNYLTCRSGTQAWKERRCTSPAVNGDYFAVGIFPYEG